MHMHSNIVIDTYLSIVNLIKNQLKLYVDWLHESLLTGLLKKTTTRLGTGMITVQIIYFLIFCVDFLDRGGNQ